MRIKITLLSFLVFLFLGALFLFSFPQQANACAPGGCTGTCNVGYYYSGTYCNYYTYSTTSCTTGCPTPTPTPTTTPTPTPVVCTAPDVACSECVSSVCNNAAYCATSCSTDCSLCGGTPTPSPTSTPIPTATPGPTYTISGNVFIDTNKDQKLDNGETDYTGGITITSTGGTVVYPDPSNRVSGTYQVAGLAAGSYTISYTSLPTAQGYQMTVPTGIPPQFSVTVGSGCVKPANSPDATCSSGNLTGLNFGIANDFPWVQTSGSDVRADNGFSSGTGAGAGGGGGGSFYNPIPSTANTACSGGAYMSVPQGAGGTAGVVFSGNSSANFGQGSASTNNWSVGSPAYSENFGPIGQGGVIRTSFAYLQSIAKQANLTPTDLSGTDPSTGQPYCSGGIANCTLEANIPHGLYISNQSLTIAGIGTNNTLPSGQNYVILVNGDLNIDSSIHVPVGSTLLISASGNINVASTVGSAYNSTASDLEGYFSADKSFIILGTNNCSVGPDLRLNVAGGITVNAALGGGTFQNNRDLCANDIYCPVFTIQQRPDFLLNAPTFLRQTNYTWQEVAP